MDFGSETALRSIDSELGQIGLTCKTKDGLVEYLVEAGDFYRAYDGRLGIECFHDGGGSSRIPFDVIEKWSFIDTEGDLEEYDEPVFGDIEALKSIRKSEIEYLMKEVDEMDLDGQYIRTTWDRLVEEERLSRMAPSQPYWYNNPEMVIYLTLAASTANERSEDIGTRVGGALWAACRGSNPERVAMARQLIGLKAGDELFIEAAEGIDPHEVARVSASGMFVGLGGSSGTEETMRLLTLLQNHSPVPRFF